MIAKLVGILDSIYDGFVILNVSGVGYRVFCSAKTIAKLPPLNHTAILLIETQVREDHIHLFGFSDATEQQLFNILTVVQGVGSKVGLSILSSLCANDIQIAVITGDVKAFTHVPGIGPKLATRLVTELKGKMGNISTNESLLVLSTASKNMTSSKVLDDAISALVNLGYSRTEAGITTAQLLRENPEITVSDLIRLSLKEIGKANG